MKNKILTLVTIGALALASTIRAEQNGAGHYISGQQSDFSSTVPMTPGFYFANFFLDYNDATFSPAKPLPFGDLEAFGVTVNSQAVVPTGIYVYPVNFLGGRLASGLCVPYVWVDVKAQATLDKFGNSGPSREDRTSGLGDIELMPIMAGWTNGGFSFNGMFNVWAPTGEYEKGNLATAGLGYWTFEPMVAVSWLSRKIGTEATIFAAVDFNTENTDANYQSGNIFHVDATLAQHVPLFGGLAGAGVTAFYLKQFTDDSGSGKPAPVGGFEAKSYGIGPTVSYVHPIGKSTLVVDGSWLPQTYAENTTKGNFIWVKASLAF